MITIYYFSLITRKQEEMQCDYPEQAVSFIQNTKASAIITGISCVDDEDLQYINERNYYEKR